MRLKLISCEVFEREMRAVIARSPNQVDLEFLSMGLHSIGCVGMRERMQEALDRVPAEGFDAVAFGYGLCNNGLAGLRARTVPLVIPRAHDCITLLLGSKERYLDYFQNNPGVYFKSTGWIEHSTRDGELQQLSIAEQSGMYASYEELVAKYGEDNAKFLFDELVNHSKHYGQFTFIEMGVEPDDRFERQTQEEAAQRGWKYAKVRGDLSLLQRLVDGRWNAEDFLVVPPGCRVVAKYDDGVIAAEPVMEPVAATT